MELSSSMYQLDMIILKVFFNLDSSTVLKKKKREREHYCLLHCILERAMHHLCLCDFEFQMYAHKINIAHGTDNIERHSKNTV